MQTTRKKSKGEQTRAVILETALRLFRERGFEETTMRMIAEEADVALGNAYYYFRSKDELILEFYERIQKQHHAACEGVLMTERTLKARLSGVLKAQMGVMLPYHRLFVSLFKVGADPASTVSPFSPETRDCRDAAIQRFEEIVRGAQDKIPAELAGELPQLLWLYNLGLVLFWIYDRSDNFVRSYKLIELSSEIVSNLISLASMPIMQPLRKMVLTTLTSLREV